MSQRITTAIEQEEIQKQLSQQIALLKRPFSRSSTESTHKPERKFRNRNHSKTNRGCTQNCVSLLILIASAPKHSDEQVKLRQAQINRKLEGHSHKDKATLQATQCAQSSVSPFTPSSEKVAATEPFLVSLLYRF